MIVTSAPSPTAILAAFVPACPPPMIVTLPRLTPGTPASKIPLPPLFFSRNCAPICAAIRPATSLIGASNGRERFSNCTVSYAIETTFFSINAFVNSGSGAKCKYVNKIKPSLKCLYSLSIGSLTFITISMFQASSAVSTIFAPASTY
ncbi:Uncharacterised protein [Streptococcus pneumoniae]|nr:Uncharacterised protein [Streptococcus pneumoniae]